MPIPAPVDERDHIRGRRGAPVTLVEYGDFQSAACAVAHPFVEELLRLRVPAVRLVYRHFPYPPTAIHPYSVVAAEVAEAVGARQLFWRMHDWLYENQEIVDRDSLRRTVERMGLEPGAVDLAVSQHVYRDRVWRDVGEGMSNGVTGTPTFFVNGVPVGQGAQFLDLLRVVDQAVVRNPVTTPVPR